MKQEDATHALQLRIAPRPGTRPRVKRHRAEEVVRAQANTEREEQVRERVRLGFCRASERQRAVPENVGYNEELRLETQNEMMARNETKHNGKGGQGRVS
jgi:hypothetical protein